MENGKNQCDEKGKQNGTRQLTRIPSKRKGWMVDWIVFIHLFIDFDKRAIVCVWFISIFIYEMNYNFDVDPDIINQTNGSFIFHHFHSLSLEAKHKIQNTENTMPNENMRHPKRHYYYHCGLFDINVEFTV